MSLTDTVFCFSPSNRRNADSSKVSSGGGVRLCFPALKPLCGGRKDMKALYTNAHAPHDFRTIVLSEIRIHPPSTTKASAPTQQSGVKCSKIAFRRRAVKQLTILSIPFLFLVLSTEAQQQPRNGMSPPPSPMNTGTIPAQVPLNVQRRI